MIAKLHELPDELVVPFDAYPAKNYKVTWMHQSLPATFSPEDLLILITKTACLLPIFQTDQQHLVMTEPQQRFADFYGGSGGADNGGSGRCGIFEFCGTYYQVKGIGATPLVGKHDDYMYRHGGIPVDQGLQEVVYGNFCDAFIPDHKSGIVMMLEFPDLATPYDHPTIPNYTQTRAVILREFTPRIAHFLPNNNQHGLWERSKDMIRCASAWNWIHQCGIDLEESMRKFGRTVAMTKILRTMHGASLGGNLTATGDLIDFGTFDVLPDFGECVTTRIGCTTWNEHDLIIGDLINAEMTITELFHQRYHLSDWFIDGYTSAWSDYGLLVFGIVPSEVSNREELTTVNLAIYRYLNTHAGKKYIIREGVPNGVNLTPFMDMLGELVVNKANPRMISKLLKNTFHDDFDGKVIREFLLKMYTTQPRDIETGIMTYRAIERIRDLIPRNKLIKENAPSNLAQLIALTTNFKNQ